MASHESEKSMNVNTARAGGALGYVIPGGRIEIGEEVWSRPETRMRTRKLTGNDRSSNPTGEAINVFELDVD